MTSSRRWCFTVHFNNNSPQKSEQELCDAFNAGDFRWGKHGTCQLEVGSATERMHVQGYVVFDKMMRLSAVKKLHPTAHWEPMKGSIEQNEEYCTKTESRVPGTEPDSWGERGPGSGFRSDLNSACAMLRSDEYETVHTKMRRIATTMPDVVVKYYRGLEYVARLLTPPVPVDPPPEWRQWQKDLIEELKQSPDNRHIIWYTDSQGGAGKSTLVTWYSSVDSHKAQVLSGKVADMSYVYNEDTRVAFFDVTRTQAENMDHLYSFAESLKNGRIMSTKYESREKRFRPPHVVFFANSMPCPGKWSDDRAIIRSLSTLTF